jgi:hypothetical protein
LFVPNIERNVLGQREAQAAVLGRERVPEQAHVRGRLADVGRDRVGVLDLVLARDDPVADEHPDRVQDVGELSSFHDRQVSDCRRWPVRALLAAIAEDHVRRS